VTFGTRGGGGRRAGKRVDVALTASLITMSDRHPAILFNISQTGAKVRAKSAPPKGTELFLQLGTLDVYAHVIWQENELCGLRFDVPIRAWDVEQLRLEAQKGTLARLTAAEKGGADDWTHGVAR
jgi:hypothetical protein